jgi:DNA polymerase-3 subunit epsilon
MKTILTFDTETTDLPNWKVPSDDPSQPHLVQLAAILSDAETQEVIEKMDVIIKPDGWIIPQETIDIHGITNEKALEVGIPETEAVQMLIDMWVRNGVTAERVAYNKTFDQRIIRIAMKRYFDEEIMNKWAVKDDHHCAMRMDAKLRKAKQRKLVDAYKDVCGKELEGAHNAMADAEATHELYYKLVSLA